MTRVRFLSIGAIAIASVTTITIAQPTCDAPTIAQDVSPQELPVLDSLSPVIKTFNEQQDKARIVALLSPTCGGCVHGAEALLAEAMNAYPNEDFSMIVVWEAMLDSDKEDAARRVAAMFADDDRVVQFWDPDTLSGIAYSRDVFPHAWRDLKPHMPKDSPIRKAIERGADAEPGRRPMWDFAAFYPPGITWDRDAPRPESFVRQLAIWKQPDGSTEATLVTDTFDKAPVQSDWFDEVRSRMTDLLGSEAIRAEAAAASTNTEAPCCETDTVAVASGEGVELISLADSTDTFRRHFNEGADKPRFVTILSSTCGPCVSGAVTTNESIVRGFPDGDIEILVVWIDVLASDALETATRASSIFDDERVTQYHDPNQLLGNAFADGLLKRPPAWDIYLFYPPNATWIDSVPEPMDWMHQLGGGVAEMSRYKTEALLAADMHAAMLELGFKSDRGAPSGEELARARDVATGRIGAAACAADAKADGAAQCPRCENSGTIGQCSISGWRYVVANRVRGEDGELTGRFEMTGAAEGPIDLGVIDASDTRHEFTVEGMTCPDCATAVVGKALQARGVTRVEVDYHAKKLVVFTRDEPGAKLEMLPMHLGLAGYQVTRVEG